jgi:predicted nucleic acid-binding protein
MYKEMEKDAVRLAQHTNLAEGFTIFIAVALERRVQRVLVDEANALTAAIAFGWLLLALRRQRHFARGSESLPKP